MRRMFVRVTNINLSRQLAYWRSVIVLNLFALPRIGGSHGDPILQEALIRLVIELEV